MGTLGAAAGDSARGAGRAMEATAALLAAAAGRAEDGREPARECERDRGGAAPPDAAADVLLCCCCCCSLAVRLALLLRADAAAGRAK